MGSRQCTVNKWFYFSPQCKSTDIAHSPVNKDKLFNLHHASAHNVIKHIFGVLKRQFRILLIAPEYKPDVQARIPAALGAIHNFIREFDPAGGEVPADSVTGFEGGRGDGDGVSDNDDVRQGTRRDRITTEMWTDYIRVLEDRDLLNETDDDEKSPYSNGGWDDYEEDSEQNLHSLTILQESDFSHQISKHILHSLYNNPAEIKTVQTRNSKNIQQHESIQAYRIIPTILVPTLLKTEPPSKARNCKYHRQRYACMPQQQQHW